MHGSRRERRYNFNGNLHRLKEATAECEMCRNTFTFIMTTKPRRFCNNCKEQADEAANQRRYKRRKEREMANGGGEKKREPRPKLIPYAGYDGS